MDRMELSIVNSIKDAILIGDLYTTVDYVDPMESKEYEKYVFDCIHNEIEMITNIFK